MATVRDIISQTLKMIGVLSSGEEPSAADASDVLVVINDIGRRFESQEINSGWSDLSLSDEFPLDEKHGYSFKCILAVSISPMFGKQVNPIIVMDASRGMNLIAADYAYSDPVSEPALATMPSQRRYF